MDDQNFMREALLEAKKAFSKGEVPVGAVLVSEGKIIARAHNLVEEYQDASHHAEMLCIQTAAKKMGNWRLQNAILYCTLEPCVMCAGAITLFRVKKVIYGAKDIRHGAHKSVVSFLGQPHPIHTVQVEGGMLAENARDLMQDFFRARRREDVGKTFRRNDCFAGGESLQICRKNHPEYH